MTAMQEYRRLLELNIPSAAQRRSGSRHLEVDATGNILHQISIPHTACYTCLPTPFQGVIGSGRLGPAASEALLAACHHPGETLDGGLEAASQSTCGQLLLPL